eukprot:jgi/Ulvmu1/9682/UM055_0020.1
MPRINSFVKRCGWTLVIHGHAISISQRMLLAIQFYILVLSSKPATDHMYMCESPPKLCTAPCGPHPWTSFPNEATCDPDWLSLACAKLHLCQPVEQMWCTVIEHMHQGGWVLLDQAQVLQPIGVQCSYSTSPAVLSSQA